MLFRNFLFTLSISVFFFISCQEPEVFENKAMEKQLMGEWKSVSIKITMNTFSNRDSTKVFEVNESDWEQKMNIRSYHNCR